MFYLLYFSAFGVTNDTLLVERPPTGNRRRRDVALPLDQQSLGLFESTKSTTLLPSQECSTSSKPHPSATPTAHQDALQPEVLVKNDETLSTISTTAPNMIATNTAMYSAAVSHDTALQQQLTQQQLLMQQQSLQLQQLSSELATSKMQLEQARSEGERNSTQVKEKLLQELDLVKNQLKEVQEKLQEEKTASSNLKVCTCMVVTRAVQ